MTWQEEREIEARAALRWGVLQWAVAFAALALAGAGFWWDRPLSWPLWGLYVAAGCAAAAWLMGWSGPQGARYAERAAERAGRPA